jgi:hypothetical protein
MGAIKTIWLREFYDPSTPPQPAVAAPQTDKPLSKNAKSVLGAAQKGYLSTRQAQNYLCIARISVERAHKELQEAGLLIGIGKGTARRYLVDRAIG